MKPVLLDFGSWQMASYPAMLTAGACVLIWIGANSAVRDSLPRHHVALLLAAAFYAGLGGARLLYVLEHRGTFAEPLRAVLSPAPGGLAAWGGLMLGCLAAAAYCRLAGLSFVQVADAAAVGLCVFGVSARVGCLLAGCCYGRPAPEALGVVFPAGSEASLRWGAGVAVYATQIHEAAGLALAAAVLQFNHRLGRHRGDRFLLMASFYAALRFVNDFLRGDTSHMMPGLTPGQWMSLGALLVAVSVWTEPGRGRRRLCSGEDGE